MRLSNKSSPFVLESSGATSGNAVFQLWGTFLESITTVAALEVAMILQPWQCRLLKSLSSLALSLRLRREGLMIDNQPKQGKGIKENGSKKSDFGRMLG